MPSSPLAAIPGITFLTRVAAQLHGLMHATRAGLVRAESPQSTLGVIGAVRRYGALGGAVSIAAIRYGDRAGLLDELGTLPFGELDRAT